MIAITRDVSKSFASCELTHLPRVPIDVARARVQHRAYEDALKAAGYAVRRLAAPDDMPDSVFVEDIAVVLEEVAIITRPGAESRRREIPAVIAALEPHRQLHVIEAPATLDGGDVLIAERRVFVGVSSRTNSAAVLQLRHILGPLGYVVSHVEVRECLHLKSAVTSVAPGLLLMNPDWCDPEAFDGFEYVPVDPGERAAANAVRLADRLIFPSAFPRTADRLRARGMRVETVDASELAKAEGAVTCCSLIVD